VALPPSPLIYHWSPHVSPPFPWSPWGPHLARPRNSSVLPQSRSLRGATLVRHKASPCWRIPIPRGSLQSPCCHPRSAFPPPETPFPAARGQPPTCCFTAANSSGHPAARDIRSHAPSRGPPALQTLAASLTRHDPTGLPPKPPLVLTPVRHRGELRGEVTRCRLEGPEHDRISL
jgi:hypothetical protein